MVNILVRVTSAKSIHQDGVKMIELNQWYKLHHDEAIGNFIIAKRGMGVHGVITLDDLRFYSTYERTMWVWEMQTV